MRTFLLRITLLFMLLPISVFSQQFLWSTINKENSIYVPIENVTDEVMKFYNHYEFYYDGTGYNKEGFLKYFLKFDNKSQDLKDFKKLISEIKDTTVMAFKSNLGKGSVIMVMIIGEKNVDFVAFSNNYESDVLLTHNYSRDEREKFERWFSQLLR